MRVDEELRSVTAESDWPDARGAAETSPLARLESCLLVRRLLCDTHGSSANDALRVKARSPGAPAASAGGLHSSHSNAVRPS